MAKTNHNRIGEALELLNEGLLPFVERELQSVYGDKWKKQTAELFPVNSYDEINWDTSAILKVMWDAWNAVFRNTLGHAERSLVSELRKVRNDWAHQNQFNSDDAYRAMDSASRLLDAVSAGPQAEKINAIKTELMRTKFEQQRRNEKRKILPIEGQPTNNLPSWREIVTPHKDVASGKYPYNAFTYNGQPYVFYFPASRKDLS